jgi:DNA-binding CsgD family transcriptional regulator/PAS domain-containing protein
MASQSLLDAAIDPSLWTDAMETVAQYAGANGAVILQVKGRGPGTPHSRSLQEGLEVYFRDEWHLRDERNRGLPLVRKKGIFVDQDFASREEIATSDYYRGFLAKHDINWSAGIGFSSGEDEWCLVLQRGDRQGFFQPREQADLVRFAVELNRAASIARSLAYANATGMLDAYESIGDASFLLDRYGRVTRMNARAQRLIGDGLFLHHGRLNCIHPQDSAALASLIAALTAHEGAAKALPLVAARRPAKRSLAIQGIPLTGLASAVFSPAKSILLVADTEQLSITPIEHLRTMFGLTAAEAILVSHLEQEATLADAAGNMGIAFETARSYLKQIFSKTGTGRQSELLMLLRRLPRTV